MNILQRETCFFRDQTNQVSVLYEHSIRSTDDVSIKLQVTSFQHGGKIFVFKINIVREY